MGGLKVSYCGLLWCGICIGVIGGGGICRWKLCLVRFVCICVVLVRVR